MPSFERNEIEPTLAVVVFGRSSIDSSEQALEDTAKRYQVMDALPKTNVSCVTPDGARYGSDLATMGVWIN